MLALIAALGQYVRPRMRRYSPDLRVVRAIVRCCGLPEAAGVFVDRPRRVGGARGQMIGIAAIMRDTTTRFELRALRRQLALHLAATGAESKIPNHEGTRLRFARDSPPEGDGFELPVPQQIRSRFRASSPVSHERFDGLSTRNQRFESISLQQRVAQTCDSVGAFQCQRHSLRATRAPIAELP
jgi:hypothetical protein